MEKDFSDTQKIKKKALDLGFSAVGISNASFLVEESHKLRKWLENVYHGEMQYMENHFEKRTDPRKLVEGAKSVISVLLNYYPKEKQIDNTFKISKYTYGKDYHYVLKEKLNILLDYIRVEIGAVNGRAFVDSAPVMDKAWAAKAGLGWIGKNTNLISKDLGSFFFIGELIIDLELEADTPIKDYCGTCTKCIEACPTSAISPYQMDARKCISYLTIEKKGEIPEEYNGKLNDWIFGCDICQDVCPWNSKVKSHSEAAFNISDKIKNLCKEEWQNLDIGSFKKYFRNSPVNRLKYEGLKRNIDFIKKPLAKS